jgi:hypothetical protein
MKNILFVVAALVAAVGCGKGGAGGGGGGMPDVFKGFGDGGGAKWDGTWVAGADLHQVWTVKGSDLTIIDKDGKEEKRKLHVVSPCEVAVDEDKGGGATMTSYYTYAWEGDKLYLGMGAGGFKKGEDAIVCSVNLDRSTYVIRGGKCEACKSDMMTKAWKCAPSDCSIKGDVFDAADTFDKDKRRSVPVKGDMVLSEQLAGNTAEKMADVAAAKAKLAQ